MLGRIINISILLSFFAININAQSNKKEYGLHEGYEISGIIKGLNEGEKVSMMLAVSDFKLESKDSGYVKNGVFKISGIVQEGPRYYHLVFEKHPYKIVTMLIDNNEKITITGIEDISKIKHTYLEHYMKIEGSPTNNAVRCMAPVILYYRENCSAFQRALNKLKDSIGFDPKLVDAIMNGQQMLSKYLKMMFFDKPEPDYMPAFPELCKSIVNDSRRASFLPVVFNSLNDHLKNSFYGKQLKKYMALCVGQPLPTFTLPTIDGKELKLTDVLTKSKLTIVHLWASNSYEVSRYQEELQSLYNKYGNKGLSIVGVSSDTDVKKWKIAASDLPWHHVSDLKGGKGVVENLYHEYSTTPGYLNTTNILLDEKGNIIAWDPTGLELQWYLWKYFGS